MVQFILFSLLICGLNIQSSDRFYVMDVEIFRYCTICYPNISADTQVEEFSQDEFDLHLRNDHPESLSVNAKRKAYELSIAKKK